MPSPPAAAAATKTTRRMIGSIAEPAAEPGAHAGDDRALAVAAQRRLRRPGGRRRSCPAMFSGPLSVAGR